MIFSADLDHTLIFTPKWLADGAAVIPAERRMGEPFSFMTAAALDTLREIQRHAVCLINTMRGLEQARRVQFVADDSCQYLALQNGLYLYRDGVPDTGWAQHVARTVNALPLGLTDAAQRVLDTLAGIICLSKQYAYLAVFFVEPSDFDDAACAQMADALRAQGWALYRQRKKLYLYPLAIDKGAVLRRVRELEDGGTIGFGDSYFDLPMLSASDTAYSLRDCELADGAYGFPIHYSTKPAQAGSQEILSQILQHILEQTV